MILRIALRYLFAKKSHKVVNVISIISIAGVAVATAAIVVVLSVFNGFTDLAHMHLSAVDPDMKVVSRSSKTFAAADSLAAILESLPEVDAAMPVLQERALFASQSTQMPVIVKGVAPDKVRRFIDFDAVLLDGVYSPDNGTPDSVVGVQLAVAVAVGTGLRPSPFSYADIYMPRRIGRINPANPAAAYRTLPVTATGVFRVDQPEYDNEYVFAPLEAVRDLLEYSHGEASAIEVKGAYNVSETNLQRVIATVMGDGYDVLSRQQQQEATYKMIAVEKWVTFLMLVCILLIASFNIVSTLSLMVIEKRDNMSTLRALGATRTMVQGVFVAEGWLITAVGGIIGVAFGTILCLLQQHLGLIKLAADPTALSIDVYPVVVQATDIVAVLLTIAAVGVVIGLVSKIFTRKFY